MGWRYRKSLRAGPFRINLSKRGVGWSVGTKGFRRTHTATGKTYETYSLPGTGISYRASTRGPTVLPGGPPAPPAAPTEGPWVRRHPWWTTAAVAIPVAVVIGSQGSSTTPSDTSSPVTSPATHQPEHIAPLVAPVARVAKPKPKPTCSASFTYDGTAMALSVQTNQNATVTYVAALDDGTQVSGHEGTSGVAQFTATPAAVPTEVTISVKTSSATASCTAVGDPSNATVAAGAVTPPTDTSTAIPVPPGGGTYTNSDGNTVPDPVSAPAAPSGATAQCNDGTYSFSQHHSGTCSHHGGVAVWL